MFFELIELSSSREGNNLLNGALLFSLQGQVRSNLACLSYQNSNLTIGLFSLYFDLFSTLTLLAKKQKHLGYILAGYFLMRFFAGSTPDYLSLESEETIVAQQSLNLFFSIILAYSFYALKNAIVERTPHNARFIIDILRHSINAQTNQIRMTESQQLIASQPHVAPNA